jgi:acyl-CoA synthetase (AMP-forming)/AMP-acid ligase II
VSDPTWSRRVGALRDSRRTTLVGVDGDGSPITTWTGDDVLAGGAAASAWLDHIGADHGLPVPALVGTGIPAIALLVAGAGSHRPMALVAPRLVPRELAAVLSGYDSPVVVAEAAYADAAARAATETGQRVEVVPELDTLARPSNASVALDLDPGPGDVVVVLHTSGTSGVPKAIELTQRRVAARARNTAAFNLIDGDSVYCTMSPFHHMAGVGNVLNMLWVGGGIVTAPPFDVDGWPALARLGITHALLVPTMIDRLLAGGIDLDLGGLRVLSYGAAPIHPDTLIGLQRALPHVGLVQVYGMTEGSPLSVLSIDDHRAAAAGQVALLETVGRAAPGIELHVADAGQWSDDGFGEVWARGEHVHSVGDDGWLHTGDLGSLDGDGYLRLRGRANDRIVRGGENVEPLEVEHVVQSHPGVDEAVVIGIPDRRWGEVVAAFVVVDPAVEPPSVDELRDFARQRLAGFKVPTEWHFVEAIPRTESGKVLRRVLRSR